MFHKVKPWLVWGLATCFAFYQLLIQGSPSVMIPSLMIDLNVDIVQIGFVTSSFFYTYIILQVPIGVIIDLCGPRRTILVGISLCSLASIYFSLVTTPTQAIATRMMMGVMSSPAIVTSLCLAARWFKSHHFVFIVGLTEMIALLGGAVGEGFLAKVVVSIGWRKTMLSVGIGGLVLFLLALIFIQDWPVKMHKKPHRTFKKVLTETKNNNFSVMKIPQVWLYGCFAGLSFSLYPAFAALWSVPYLKDRYGIGVDIAAAISSMFFIGGALGNFLLGWLSLYIPKKNNLMKLGTVLSLSISIVIFYAPGISAFGMYFLFFLFGFVSCTYSLAFTCVEQLVSQPVKGVAMGLTNLMSLVIGAPILQPVVGILIKYKNYSDAMICFPLVICLALIISFFIHEKKTFPKSC